MNSFVHSANSLATHWAPLLWRASWQGGIVVGIVWLVCRAFPRIPAATRHVFWLLAAAQMLVRLAVVSPISLPILPAALVTETTSSVEAGNVQQNDSFEANPIRSTHRPATSNSEFIVATQAKQAETLSIEAWVILLWIVGVALTSLSSVQRLIRTRHLLRNAIEVEGDDVIWLVAELSAQIGVSSPPVRESEEAPCPLLAGWFKPTILLPAGSSHTLPSSELKMALAHELTHLKRNDLWLGILPVLTHNIFFFHPLAWIASNEASMTREEACDCDAMRFSGSSPAAYARLLLNSAQSSSQAAVMGTALGYRLIQRRINMLKSSSNSYGIRTRRALSILAVLGAVCALPWTVTAQSSVSKPATSPQKSASKAKHEKKVSHAKAALKPKSTIFSPESVSGAKPSAPLAIRPATPAVPFSGRMDASDNLTTLSAPPSNLSVPSRPISPAPTANFSGARALLPPVRNSGVEAPARASAPTMPAGVSQSLPASDPSGDSKTSTHIHFGTDGLEVNFVEVDIWEAIKRLAESTHTDFVIKSGVKHDNVTLSLHSTSFEKALIHMFDAVNQPVTFRVEEGVYHIIPKE